MVTFSFENREHGVSMCAVRLSVSILCVIGTLIAYAYPGTISIILIGLLMLGVACYAASRRAEVMPTYAMFSVLIDGMLMFLMLMTEVSSIMPVLFILGCFSCALAWTLIESVKDWIWCTLLLLPVLGPLVAVALLLWDRRVRSVWIQSNDSAYFA